MKKALKIVRNILIVIILLILLFVLVCFISQMIGRKKDKDILGSHGYCNLVSAGDIELNVVVFGSESPEHTIVALPGSGDTTFMPAMKAFSEYVSGDNRFVVIDRPGYGLSDLSKDMTAEAVVEYSRTALKNAGIEAPYVLMPHSLSGIYATYWISTYPDEFEGVFFLDSTFDPDTEMSAEPMFVDKMLNFAVTTGIFRMLGGSYYSGMVDMLPEQYKADAELLCKYRPFNKAVDTEFALIDENKQKAWDSIKSTDMPKIYVYSDPTDREEFDDIFRFTVGDDFDEIPDDIKDEQYEFYMGQFSDEYVANRKEYVEKLGNCELVNVPASHFLYLHKPEETAKQLERLLDKIG